MSELTTQPAPADAKRPAWRQVYCEQGIRTEELQFLDLPMLGRFVLRAVWSEVTQRGDATICNDNDIVLDLCSGSFADREHFKRVAYNAATQRLTDALLEMANQVLTLKNTEPITVQD
ncbi:hypothetical protein [uncultured Duncaniella sp.]|uniref:hypothetical protein n=1 Tax=uncultured Duncaniella sp. TaxID=2768039 RepID=UPI0025AA1AB0|nr:hypothetical protein [uncultured Duncaniella sp.]